MRQVYCRNPEYVRWFSQRIWGWRNSLIGIVAMCVLPVGAGLSQVSSLSEDTSHSLSRWHRCVLPVGAGLSDTFGRKPILVFDNVLTFLGEERAGSAPTQKFRVGSSS